MILSSVKRCCLGKTDNVGYLAPGEGASACMLSKILLMWMCSNRCCRSSSALPQTFRFNRTLFLVKKVHHSMRRHPTKNLIDTMKFLGVLESEHVRFKRGHIAELNPQFDHTR